MIDVKAGNSPSVDVVNEESNSKVQPQTVIMAIKHDIKSNTTTSNFNIGPGVSKPTVRSQTFIIQKYIERPLLCKGGRKFDIRLWALLSTDYKIGAAIGFLTFVPCALLAA